MKVKVIKVEDKKDCNAIGKIYDAIKIKVNVGDYRYVMPCEELGCWFLPEKYCEVIPDNTVITVDNQVIKKENILLVEDGSVDIDKLEQDGFYVIVYRNGSQPPMWLK